MDIIETAGRMIKISIIDVANPLVFVNARDVGLTGSELPHEFTTEKLSELEEIRSIAAEKCQFAKKDDATRLSPAVPQLTIIAPPENFTDVTGVEREAEDMDCRIRMLSMQKPHQALAITDAICTTAAAFWDDTIFSGFMKAESEIIRLAHPAGIMETKVDLIAGEICAIKVVRTARIILEGSVYTKNNYKFVSKLA